MWIKICGITRGEDALAVQQAGADAIGLNFYSGSKRYVSVEAARGIVRAINAPEVVDSVSHTDSAVVDKEIGQTNDRTAANMDLVGVFVNAAPESVVETVGQVGLTVVQFHGDETPAEIGRFHQLLPQIPIVRAVRINRECIATVTRSLQELMGQVSVTAVLVDALVSGQFGGTGHTVDSELFIKLREQLLHPRLILAGGLNAENVGELIRTANPWGVDTASGVETQPGIKDQLRVQKFVESARRIPCCESHSRLSSDQ